MSLQIDDKPTARVSYDEKQQVEVVNEQANPTGMGQDEREGGLRGWATVLGCICIQMCGMGYTSSFGVYQDYYTRVYITNASASSISWIGSINTFLIIGSGLFTGALYDRGYFYYLLYGGSFLISFSLFMLSLCQPNNLFQNFLAQGLGVGLGTGMMFIPSFVVVSQYFKKKRALAMTIVTAGSSIGAIIHPIMLNNLFYSRLGFAGTVRASAGLVSGLLLIACCLIRPDLPPQMTRPPLLKSIRRFYQEPPYIAVSVGMLFFTVGCFYPLFYIQLDAHLHGINKTLSFYSVAILSGAGLFGRVTPGLFVHSIGVLNMIVVSCFCCSAIIFSMAGLSSSGSMVVISIIYGFMLGSFLSLQAPLITVLTSDMSELGTRMGVAYTFCAFGALIGPPILGALLTSEFIWWRPAVVSGIFTLVGASCFAYIVVFLRRKSRMQAKEEQEA